MWNLVYANRTCNKWNKFREHKEHIERLANTRHIIDDSEPKKPKFFDIRAKKEVMKRETNDKINYENTVLYNKMYELSVKPSPYSKSQNIPAYCPAFDKTKSGYKEYRKHMDIYKTNKKLRKRFQSAKPTYSTRQLLKENNYNKYLQKNISNKKNNPNLDYATFSQFKKNLTIAIEREEMLPQSRINQEFINEIASKTNNSRINNSRINNSRMNNSKTISNNTINANNSIFTNHYTSLLDRPASGFDRPLSGKPYNTEKNKPMSGKTRMTLSTIANTTY